MTIMNKGNLSLRSKTFIDREALPHEICIVEWNDDKEYCWTIASFEKDDEDCFYIKSCGDRVDGIDWISFGALVELGFKYLETLEK